MQKSVMNSVIGQKCIICNEAIMQYGHLSLINPEPLADHDNFAADACHKWCVRDEDVEV